MDETPATNAEQIEYWNEQAGSKWVRMQQKIDAQIAPIGARAMDALAVAVGERLLDIGCGCGATTIELARRVGPTGHVIGIDISEPMLGAAQRAVDAAGLTQVELRRADAQVAPIGPALDGAFSRFGVMFFENPTAAFTNIARGLRPGGRLAFACWQALPLNEWIAAPLMAAAAHVPLPEPPPEGSPGPFAFADPDRVRSILDGAGLTDVVIEPTTDRIAVGGGESLEEVVDFLAEIGPLARLMTELDAEGRARVTEAVTEVVRGFETPTGIAMGSAAWIVTARKP